jgi:hypothetical protein
VALQSFPDLKDSLAKWLSRDDLTEVIPDFILLAEERLNREIRVKKMEKRFEVDVESATGVVLPEGYVELIHAYVDTSPVQWLERKSASWIYHSFPNRTEGSTPLYIGSEVDVFIFGPAPSVGLVIKGIYYAKPDFLTVSKPTNLWVTEYPSLILYASLLESAPFLMDDERVVLWDTMYMRAKERAHMEYDVERFSGSILRTTPA